MPNTASLLPSPNLVLQCVRLVQQLPVGYLFGIFFFLVAVTAITITRNQIQILIVNGKSDKLVALFGVLIVLEAVIDLAREMYMSHIANKLQKMFARYGFLIYETIDIDKRPQLRVFNGLLNSAADSINQMIDWGLFATAYMLGQIMSAVMSLYVFDFSNVDLVILPIGLVVTYHTVRFFQKRQAALQEKKRHFDENQDVNQPRIEAMFECGLITAAQMANFVSDSMDSQTTISIGRKWIFRSFDICMSLIILLYSIYFPDDKSFIVRYMMMNTITSGLSCYIGFNTQYVHILHLYARFCKKVNDLVVDTSSNCVYDIIQIKPSGICIRSMRITQCGYTIEGKNLNIRMRQGVHILLTGDNGTGKSSLMKELVRFQKTIFYPPNFFNKLPHNGSFSIANTFDTTNPSDFSIIESYMRLLYGDKYTDVSGHFFPLDEQNKKKLSEGQMQILFLVWILYQIEKKRYSMLFLDEPEKNISELTMPKVMRALYDSLSKLGVTTIWCTHANIGILAQTGMVFTGGNIEIVRRENLGTVSFTKPKPHHD